ncbi:hypothetical protein [Ramlibacter sp. WS9]|uniref:ORC-CDC6 family AAA ATPase n=1 Tax=Ramlibacter sp. WS9 TaxID=1882741 RepID=UPI0013050E77|nr:hypothetical protein [Ramlibacter sp. WS9]
MPFGFPLDFPPAAVGKFKIDVNWKPRRGLYGVAYRAAKQNFPYQILKITPKALYEAFDKNWGEEVALHAQLSAELPDVIVPMIDAFDEVIEFPLPTGALRIDCYVQVLTFVDGELLQEHLPGGNQKPSGKTVAQIAIDLLALVGALDQKNIFHNDLHGQNVIVERLAPNLRRLDAIDGSIRVRAIDLGCARSKTGSRSDEAYGTGDLTYVATYLRLMSKEAVNADTLEAGRDSNVLLAVREVADVISGQPEKHRMGEVTTYQRLISTAYRAASTEWKPWSTPLQLGNLDDYYNAQTLHSWHVPELIVAVDPKHESLLARPGPVVLAGMRGCGKTMLLRSLDFHARAHRRIAERETAQDVLTRLESDTYVALFASATKLMERPDEAQASLDNRLARLFIAYCRASVRAMLHLEDIKNQSIVPHVNTGEWRELLARAVPGTPGTNAPLTLDELEHYFEHALLIALSSQDKSAGLNMRASEAFEALARLIRKSVPDWQHKVVYFLLDDVSSRYITPDDVQRLMSVFIFQSEVCAFKLSTEKQSELFDFANSAKSRKSLGRDYELLDLGEDLYEMMQGRETESVKFISNVLLRRGARMHEAKYQVKPQVVLSDCSLVRIAKEIVRTEGRKAEDRIVYAGFTAMVQCCVGDIGDIIKLYENMLRSVEGRRASR